MDSTYESCSGRKWRPLRKACEKSYNSTCDQQTFNKEGSGPDFSWTGVLLCCPDSHSKGMHSANVPAVFSEHCFSLKWEGGYYQILRSRPKISMASLRLKLPFLKWSPLATAIHFRMLWEMTVPSYPDSKRPSWVSSPDSLGSEPTTMSSAKRQFSKESF